MYKVPEDEVQRITAFIAGLDVVDIANTVMQKLFYMLEMKYEFKLSNDGETKEERI